MSIRSEIRRVVVASSIALMATAALAPIAEADRGHKGHQEHRNNRSHVVVEKRVYRPVYRYTRPTYRSYYRPAPHATYTVWRSHSGPVIAGFLGGLFLGATISNVAPVGYAYWDPYCHRGFHSLNVYHSHCDHHRHGSVVHVVEVPHGYAWSDVHYCARCDHQYWGAHHDC